MLTIKNKERLNGMHIPTTHFADWYVKSIEEVVNWSLTTKEQTPIYQIRIKNSLTKNVIDIDLHREAITRYYKIVCVRDSGTKTELISYNTLRNMSELLIRIKEVAID